MARRGSRAGRGLGDIPPCVACLYTLRPLLVDLPRPWLVRALGILRALVRELENIFDNPRDNECHEAPRGRRRVGEEGRQGG